MPHAFAKAGYLTTAEAAALLGISAATLKRWAESGLIPLVRTEGGHRRFRLEDVQALAEPPARGDDPVRRGADLVSGAADALGLQGWLLHARRELGDWWGVAVPLRAVISELYRRRTAGELGAVRLEVGLDRLRGALVRCAELTHPAPHAPRLLVAAVPGDPFLVAPALAQLAATEAGWRAEWAGHPSAADLAEELRLRPARAVVVCDSLGAPPEATRRHAAELEPLARALGVPMAMIGMGDWPGPAEAITRLGAVADLQGWLEALAAGVAPEAGPPAPAPAAAGLAPLGLRWDPGLALGHPVIDGQHEALFAHVSGFLAAVQRGEADAEVPPLVGFISDYAGIHFRYEEGLMRSAGYPGLADHVLEHEQLIRRLAALVAELGAPPGRAALEALATFLAGWLRHHVGGSDQRFGEHLRRRAPAPR